jgi:hypothetical protein
VFEVPPVVVVTVLEVWALSTVLELTGVRVGGPFCAVVGPVVVGEFATGGCAVVVEAWPETWTPVGADALDTQVAPLGTVAEAVTTQGEYCELSTTVAGTPTWRVVTAVAVAYVGVVFTVLLLSVPCVVLSLTSTPLTTFFTRVYGVISVSVEV